MKISKNWILSMVTLSGWIAGLLAISLLGDAKQSNSDLKLKHVDIESRLNSYADKEKVNQEVGQFVLALMAQTGTKMSDIRKQLIVQTVVRVTGNVFKNTEQRKQFAVLLAIESKFKRDAKSSAGAIGISQVLAKYAPSFAKICGIKDYKRSDLLDAEINMTIGACHFRALLESESIDNNIAAALVAYNAGKYSKSMRELLEGRRITHEEPPNYVAKYTYLSSEVKNLLKAERKTAVKSKKK